MLTRWDPFRDMISMRRMMDRMIDQSLGENGDLPQAEWSLPLDVVEHENEYVVKANLPGVKPDDLDITYDKGVLSIRGETKEESDKEEGQYHLRERRWGTFSRSISLPTVIQADEIQANFSNGILSLTLPKSEDVKPKRIAIQQGDQQKTIEAKSHTH